MLNFSDISLIKGCIVSEKSSRNEKKYNQYVFKVAKSCSKIRFADFIHSFFLVDVVSINSMNYKGKYKRVSLNKPIGKRADWKKMIVRIKSGQSIVV